MKMKALLVTASISLFTPLAFAAQQAISFQCDRHNILVYKQHDGQGRTIVTLNGEREDNVKTSQSTQAGANVVTISFVEYAQAGGSYGLYNLHAVEKNSMYLTSELLDADDRPKRKAKRYECRFNGVIDAATPPALTAGEQRRADEEFDARN
ncbi:hypothetical protein KGP26_29895 (plasmid) [Serratia sp. JSRIV002]|uniref:hypothetical protein n=1 Tax=Serratia sp. JSRIV002 TaxID=2831894 RepID=UPI001CBDFE8C|nr:hypothetical protein [Serratia sp. JSRIV002]UAN54761.1 hypothetical protein KGP26_29895 [Serratia sp. JSRIV002]